MTRRRYTGLLAALSLSVAALTIGTGAQQRSPQYAVEPLSAVSVRIQYDSVAAVAVAGMVTDWLSVSVLVVPLPPSQAL